MRVQEENGAAAVEFALVVPILIVLLLGIIEFGLAFSAQLQVTNAAREAARVMAIQNSTSAASSAALAAAPSLNPAMTASEVAYGITTSAGAAASSCSAGGTVTVTIRYPYRFLSGMFGAGYTQVGKAAMLCGG